tara:strand:- start:201 stop:689 length:489 start_codon:yes stop_codon:yes gene_type:complete
MEGLVCPDGTVVGRTGPNCEFEECPEVEAPLPEEVIPQEPTGQKTLIPTEKHDTYEECITAWEEALENKEILELKSNKVIIKFKQDTIIDDATSLMESYGLDPEIHPFAFPGVALENSYNLVQMLEAEVESGKELHFACEIEQNEEVVQSFPDIELTLFSPQ